MNSHNEGYMHQCLNLAKKGEGHVKSNPLVGAVIVRNEKVIATGYHHAYGKDHAEIDVLKKLNGKAEGATLYVNLEPCCHYGKTPPCTTAIIAAGIRKVVVAMRDPNPLVAGKGIAELEKAGMSCCVGILEKEAQELNDIFIHWITRKKPFVAMKVASSIDGKIGIKGKEIAVTGAEVKKYVHQLRNKYEAVLVGINTVLVDDPQLNTRLLKNGRDPLKVVLDSNFQIPLHATMLKKGKVLIVTTKKENPKEAVLAKHGHEVIHLKTMTWNNILQEIGKRNICSVLIEGGSKVFSSALHEKAVQKVYWFIAPKILGETGTVPCTEGITTTMQFKTTARVGKDLLMIGQPGDS
ncbi:bifunctional diaminohydroxyphosphoribosylaminopyrimidine deaminase/5-amino-6-(5-phosphoribosylamino)uracil reductase RibD [Candidatus Woesearchaeota archaeon]|nr:bifunctional diaminohydroxyphosphoribosylaminopyrimidine deaminase/5-amino-6-(5-phosphoribosylamino)uracil reductase RibD [Candidatus Woesearchaeota archaeon]